MSKAPQQQQSQQKPGVDVAKSEDGDLIRESSLLPGEVRTPTMVVTLSQAWGDVSGDWAAPGSSVWDEEAPSRHSAHTPLANYGVEGDVWASATGSPLLGPDDAEEGASAFAAAAEDYHQDAADGGQADAATLAAAALEALTPHGAALHADPHVLHDATAAQHVAMPMHLPQRGGGQFNPQHISPQQPRYAPEARGTYEGRFGTVHAAPTSDPIRGMQVVVPLHSPMHQYQQPPHQQQQLQQPSYFTVQEGGSRGRAPFHASPAARNYGIPVLSTNVNQGIGSAGAAAGGGGMPGYYPGQGNAAVPFVPRLDDEEVSHSIIASAGLPLSMRSLVDYIHGGQPHSLSYVSALGSTQNALRNYPNLNEPPSEEDALHAATVGARGGRAPQPSYMQHQQPQQQQQQGRWNQPSAAADNTGFAVRGSDYSGGGAHHTPSPQPAFHHNSNNSRGESGDAGGGGFVVSAGTGPTHPRFPAHNSALGGGMHVHGSYAGRQKSESEYLSDLLHFHANFFPPPPPPRVPKDERRNRAELWYHYASKWDITHRLPPPPRTPLPEMALEYRMRLQRMTRVPYHGDGWLQMGERWFDVTQTLFDFPEENVGEEVDFNVVLEQAVLS